MRFGNDQVLVAQKVAFGAMHGRKFLCMRLQQRNVVGRKLENLSFPFDVIQEEAQAKASKEKQRRSAGNWRRSQHADRNWEIFGR